MLFSICPQALITVDTSFIWELWMYWSVHINIMRYIYIYIYIYIYTAIYIYIYISIYIYIYTAIYIYIYIYNLILPVRLTFCKVKLYTQGVTTLFSVSIYTHTYIYIYIYIYIRSAISPFMSRLIVEKSETFIWQPVWEKGNTELEALGVGLAVPPHNNRFPRHDVIVVWYRPGSRYSRIYIFIYIYMGGRLLCLMAYKHL